MTMARPLPTSPTTLALLLRAATDALDFLEPIRQQLDHEWWVIRRFDQNNFNGREFFDQVHRALRLRISKGGPDYSVVLPYVDLFPAPDLSADLPDVVAPLDRVPTPGGVDRHRWKAGLVASLRKIARVRQEAHHFVRALQRLQRKLIERDESASAGLAVGPDGGVEPDGQGRGQAGPRKPAGGKTKGRAGPAAQPLAAYDQWSLGLDKYKCWQIFRQYRGNWRHHKPLPGVPAEGREWTFLKTFAEADGLLTRLALIKLVQPHFTDGEGVRIYTRIVKPTLSKLRARLRKELNLDKKADPVPWDDALKGYRMVVAVGFSDEDDQHRPQFYTREELLVGPKNWATG
jgi:hypothetical protein